jgi:hypothetical protein
MKTRIVVALGVIAGVTLAAHPTDAQRFAPRPAEGVRGQAMLNLLSEDLNAVATDFDFSAEQRGRVEGMVREFNTQHVDALDRLTAIRDSLSSMRPRRGDRESMRELVTEFRDIQRELRPAFEQFETGIGDVLTWNQGRQLAVRYGPRRSVDGLAPRVRGRTGRFDLGARRFMRGPRMGTWGRR